MNGAKKLFNRLVHHNIQCVFGYPGGAILPVLNEFHNQSKIKFILTRTEAGGSFMAEGYSKATRKPGVIMVTSGPGAINIMTSMQNALSDGTAVLALTGQVSTAVMGTDAFQEADVLGISRPCTKWNSIITDTSKIESTIDKAFHYMFDKRHGPVLIDLPKNIMSMETVDSEQSKSKDNDDTIGIPETTISYDEIHALLLSSRKPVVLVGQGIFQADCVDLLREFIDSYKVPVTSTLMGLGVVNERDRRSLKMLGMHGSYVANMATHNCDLLINLGSRFDDRIIGNPKQFAPNATIVHIDIHKKNINKTIPTKLYRVENCRTLLEQLNDRDFIVDPYHTYSWWKQIHSWKRIGFTYPPNATHLQGRHVLSVLNNLIQSDMDNAYTIVSDVGAHQMWAAQFIDYNAPRVKFITSGGLGTMGFALPASIGVKIGLPSDRVICICGDGGFQMTFQELITAKENNIGIKVIILNNSYQLMVKIWQEKFYNNNLIGTKMNNPPFELICQAMGCESMRIDTSVGLKEHLEYFLKQDGPIVLNVITDPSESVLPMVSPGKALNDMILDDNKEFSGEAPC